MCGSGEGIPRPRAGVYPPPMGAVGGCPASPSKNIINFGRGSDLFSAVYRTFKVARPITAKIREMIQKRMTIWGSDQPFFS